MKGSWLLPQAPKTKHKEEAAAECARSKKRF